jgi:hypothetical protein
VLMLQDILSSSLTLRQNKLECLHMQVYYLRVSPAAVDRLGCK